MSIDWNVLKAWSYVISVLQLRFEVYSKENSHDIINTDTFPFS